MPPELSRRGVERITGRDTTRTRRRTRPYAEPTSRSFSNPREATLQPPKAISSVIIERTDSTDKRARYDSVVTRVCQVGDPSNVTTPTATKHLNGSLRSLHGARPAGADLSSAEDLASADGSFKGDDAVKEIWLSQFDGVENATRQRRYVIISSAEAVVHKGDQRCLQCQNHPVKCKGNDMHWPCITADESGTAFKHRDPTCIACLMKRKPCHFSEQSETEDEDHFDIPIKVKKPVRRGYAGRGIMVDSEQDEGSETYPGSTDPSAPQSPTTSTASTLAESIEAPRPTIPAEIIDLESRSSSVHGDALVAKGAHPAHDVIARAFAQAWGMTDGLNSHAQPTFRANMRSLWLDVFRSNQELRTFYEDA